MSASEIEFRDAVKLGFGFGLGFATAMLALSLASMVLYMPVMMGL